MKYTNAPISEVVMGITFKKPILRFDNWIFSFFISIYNDENVEIEVEENGFYRDYDLKSNFTVREVLNLLKNQSLGYSIDAI